MVLRIAHRTDLRRRNREELIEQTLAQGSVKEIRGTQCTIRTLKTPHSHGVLISNAAGPVDQTVELHLKFVKENYRVEGMADDVDEVSRVVKPGT